MGSVLSAVGVKGEWLSFPVPRSLCVLRFISLASEELFFQEAKVEVTGESTPCHPVKIMGDRRVGVVYGGGRAGPSKEKNGSLNLKS